MALNPLLGLLLQGQQAQAQPPQMPQVPAGMAPQTSDTDEQLKQSLLRTSLLGERMGAGAMDEMQQRKQALWGSSGTQYPASPDMPGSEMTLPGKPGLFDLQSRLAQQSPYHFSDWTDPMTGEMHKSSIQGKIGNALAMAFGVRTPADTVMGQERQTVADQINSLMNVQKGAAEQATAGASAAYRPAMSAARLESAEAMKAKAGAYAQNVVNTFQTRMRELDIRSTLADSTVTLNKARAALDYAEAQYQKDRVALGYYETDANNQTRQNVAEILAQAGLDKDQAGRSIIKAVTGIDWTTKAAIPPSAPTMERPDKLPTRPIPTPEQKGRAQRVKGASKGATTSPLGSKDNPIVVSPN